jgi:outer membrane biosynthesis protein TonB
MWHTLLPVIGLMVTLTDVQTEMLKDFPRPPYPGFAIRTYEQGTVNLHLTFGTTGTVVKCRVDSSTAPKDLTDFTVDFVTKNWASSKWAGKTEDLPITFKLH